jgi:gliding motility-associatede transport system auxiliary component
MRVPKAPKSGGIGTKLLEGTNFIVYSVVVIAILVIANWFVNQHDRHWDLTPNKQFSLSDQSVKLLKELKSPVSIYVFDQKGQFSHESDLLQNYSSASHMVDVQYVDPNRDPALAKEFNVRSYGTIVVASGVRHFQAQSNDEQGVTNALIHVLKGQRTVCFIGGHGEKSLEGTDQTGYSGVAKNLGDESYTTKSVILLQQNEIPSDCAMVVIAGPQNDYLHPEVDTIEKYARDGGRVLVMLDPGKDLPNLSKMLSDWGVATQNDLVIDLNPMAQIFGTKPYMPLIIKYGTSPIVQPIKQEATLFPLTRSFDIGQNPKPGVAPDSLCETSANSFGVMDYDPKMVQISYREGKDVKGPLTVAVAGTISGSSGGKKEGRFVAVGTSEWVANAFLGFQGNGDLFMNMINWLSAEEDLISIRPKPPENQHLNMTEKQMSHLLYLGIIGLPLAVIILGFGVWWQRR